MATMMTIPPVGVQPRAISGSRKPDLDNRRSSSSSWWSPLFGWSAEPDYIDGDRDDQVKVGGGKAMINLDLKPVTRSRVAPAMFTEEKARQLRQMTRETSAFHDAMYHSAVASRLASDFSDRSGR